MAPSSHSIPWLRLVTEGAAIVVSILLALAADTAWQSRRERSEEKEELSRLEAEFRTNYDMFVEDLAGQESLVEYNERLLAFLEEAPDDSRQRVPNGLLLSLLFAPIWEPESASLDALIASGRVSLLRAREVREGIAAWSADLSSTIDGQRRAREFYVDQLLPYLSRQGDVTALLEARRVDQLRRGSGPPWEAIEGETVLRNAAELRNLVAQKLVFSGDALRRSRMALETLQQTLGTLGDGS